MDSKSSPWFAVSLGLIGIILGYGVATGTGGGPKDAKMADPTPAPTEVPPAPPPPVANLDALPPIDFDIDHVSGDKDAKVTMFVYTDFECPFCQRHHGTFEQLLDEYDDVNFVLRHYPLGFHSNAQKGAEATECAAELGGEDKFWEMTSTIFEKGADNTMYASYAEELGIDEAKFTECMDSDKYAQKTKDDMEGGTAAGVRGTPGNIIVNNETEEAELVSGAQPLSNFKAVIDGMLE
ncbi:DsbA family protein [Patescibacteria group bacterium]|nr:DsbA family protein [Patescibacteria group bacterium]MBU1123913.1 DsbA family protein [Patescibacteria group bacterium]